MKQLAILMLSLIVFVGCGSEPYSGPKYEVVNERLQDAKSADTIYVDVSTSADAEEGVEAIIQDVNNQRDADALFIQFKKPGGAVFGNARVSNSGAGEAVTGLEPDSFEFEPN